MCRPARWLPGLIPLFLLFLAAVGLKVPEIQADIAARTNAAVAPLGLAAGAARVAGRDVSLHGMTFSEAAQGRAIATADAVDGVRLVNDAVSLPVEAKPFALTATRENGTIVLAGSVPSPDVRAKIVAAARAIAPAVDDRMSYARGSAPGFDGWALAALAPLANLTRGTASLVDSALSVTGEAAGAASYQAAVAATKALPAGLGLARADIKAPVLSPYVWSAAADGKSVILEGAVPSDEARAAIAAAAKGALPGLAVVDRMQLARGAADGFAGWTRAGFAALARLTRGKASLTDSALTITGEAGDPAGYEAAIAATRALPAGLSLAKAEIAAPIASPYLWSARSDGKSLVLEGSVPSEEARAAILAAAKSALPKLAIVDHMHVARGAPAAFLPAAAAALGALGRLDSGAAGLSDLRLSLSGAARAGENADSFLKSLTGALPSGVALGSMDLRYPEQHPFVFNARKNSEGLVKIDGFSPSESLRAAALKAARDAGSSVSGDAHVAGGWPAAIDFGASNAFGLGILARLRSGEMSLGEDGLTIRGEADESTIAQVRAQLSALPAGVRVRLADLIALPAAAPAAPPPAVVAPPPQPVAPPPPAPTPPAPAPPPEARRPQSPVEAACQQQLAARLARKNIQFRTASADIDKGSEGVIADLAEVLQGCPDVKVEVAGHTDNVGRAEMNKDLSLERAKAVVEALGAAGVAANRLSAAGYGEERPIATNDTREGRAQNRRTEFVVK